MLTKILYKTTKFDSREVTLKGRKFRLLIADSLAKGSVGLMYRERIASNEGMLFLFPFEHRWEIWMLNMRFAIDVIWLDKQGVVVHVEKNLKPCKSMFDCPAYRPEKGAKYVIELLAGEAGKLRIKKGETIKSILIKK